MPNSYFKFKQFTVNQDRCAMKVGTDGVLLGAWVNCIGAKSILDIGTGTGLIALMLAQRNTLATVIGLEIGEQAYLQAKENCQKSPFSSRLTIHHKALQDYTPESNLDLIVCNPPFFKVSSKARVEQRNIARQMEHLSPIDIFGFAAKWLNSHGILSLIFPAEVDLSVLANNYGLHANRKTCVKGNHEQITKRILWEFSRANTRTEVSELIVEKERHSYTDQFKALTHDFYLNQ